MLLRWRFAILYRTYVPHLLFAITNAGGLRCARSAPGRIFVRDVQMLVTLNPFTLRSEYAGNNTPKE